jgi:hypothetical protein
LDAAVAPHHVVRDRVDQPEVLVLDLLPHELVRDAEDEGVVA